MTRHVLSVVGAGLGLSCPEGTPDRLSLSFSAEFLKMMEGVQ